MRHGRLILVAIAVAWAPMRDVEARGTKRGATTRWYGAEPHTPLAIADGRGIRSAGQPACAPWSRLRSRWRAIDAYGQVVGRAEVSARDRYDVTDCEEVALTVIEGSEGSGLFASESGSWQSPPTAQWIPSEAERASLSRLVDALRRAVSPAEPAAAAAATTLFFRGPDRAEGSDEIVGHAVIGGRILVIASLDKAGRWRLSYFENDATYRGLPAEAFRPLAVFDMDGDGWPEVIYHMTSGDAWSDSVLQTDGEGIWRKVAESVHGATA